jgi:type IV pilus assembly protein PilQ
MLMSTTTTATSERRPALRAARSRLLGILAVFGLVLGAPAHAENVLEDLAYTALPGGKVEVTLKFAGPVAEPQVFSTETPPSVALDFADTRNGLSKRRVEIGAGATSGVSVIEAAGRTRVVVDLFRIAGYDSRVNGNDVVLTINNGLIGTSSVAANAGRTDPTKVIPAEQGIQVSNVDFRRGKAGEGRVVVAFDNPGAAVNLKREGDRIVLDLLNVKPGKAQHLDVLDFATAVQSIDVRGSGSGTRVEISARPPFEQLAYQTGSEYIVEVSEKKQEAPKGKNAEPEYSGSRVTFNFQDIPTRSVLQLIADVSDLNIVVADTVQGNVTLRLINVPWDQALDIVLQAKGLDKRRRGNVIWVAPQKEIADREQAIAEAMAKMEDTEPLVTDYIPISYGKAKDIVDLMTTEAQTSTTGGAQAGGGGAATRTRGFLSARGSVTYDDRTNTLLVSDIPSKIQEIRQLIAVLDRPVQQVLIESRIVIATDSFARELGVRFGVSGGYQDDSGNVISTAGTAVATDRMSNVVMNNRMRGPNRGLPNTAPGQIPGGIAVPSLGDRLNVNMPIINPAGSFGLAILGSDYLLDLELSAAQREGRSETVSNPRVITANQKEAHITQGTEIGYSTIQASSGGSQPTVAFKDATLELKVTPTITADDRVVLDLEVKKDTLAGYYSGPTGDIPLIDKRQVASQVLVDNGQTVVLGGVYEVNKSDTITKVPLLGDIPVLGNLFKNKGRTDSKAELLIFVTPRILSDSLK